MNKISRASLLQPGLIILLVFAFLVRIFYFWGNTIPFSFDHGKDALAVMDLVLNLSPKFVGPWTSIPGLFFGPAWYYLLAPAYLAAGFNPLGAGVLMILLILIQVYLAWRYFGTLEALIIASGPMWLIMSRSIWNPFPMTLVTLGILVILKRQEKMPYLKLKSAIGLGLLAGLGFHFSAAFAIFYPVIILMILALRRTRLSIKAVLATILSFGLAFLPQALFEVKNNFIELKAIIAYFHQGEAHDFSWGKILQVIQETTGILKISVMPEFRGLPGFFNWIMVALTLVILVWGCLHLLEKKFQRRFVIENALFLIIPVIGFCFLHFNVWYVYGLAPVIVVVFGRALRTLPKPLIYVYASLMMLSPLMAYGYYFKVDRPVALQDRAFLPVKLAAIEYVRTKANGRPFASYHYEPQIYDYDYQYLYFMQAVQGKPLPTEFSYQPGESIYIAQKPALLKHFGQSPSTPELNFYIVESAQVPSLLKDWWNAQKHGPIIDTYQLSPEVTIYTAEAK